MKSDLFSKLAILTVALAQLSVRPLAAQAGGHDLILATTTSVRDAGLLDVLLPQFMDATGYDVKVIAVGSGHAMELGRRGEADILILHDPAGEERFVSEGYGVERTPLMHSEFILAGPPSDPAAVAGLPVSVAFQRIADSRSRFLSRGDNSGTHVKERFLWQLADRQGDRSWLWESGQGMGATLQIAAEIDAYVLTDIGTYLKHPAREFLPVLVSGDAELFNPYHVVRVNEARWDHVNRPGAIALRRYLLSSEVRDIIASYGVEQFGRPLFVPDTDEPD